MKYLFSNIVFILLPALVLYAQGASGETVYKGTDAQGNTIYSDQPLENGKKITITPAPTYHLPPVQPQSHVVKPVQAPDYKLSIVEPHNQETISNDITTINVKLALTPKLGPDDRINLIINGQPYGSYSRALSFSLNNFPRGSYSIQAVITSAEDPHTVIARSETITIFQQRAIARRDVGSQLAPQAPQAPQAP